MTGTWASLLGAETLFFLSLLLASLSKRGSFLGGSMVKNTPANVGDTGDVGREDPLEKGMATHSSILAWEIPWTGGPVGYSPVGHKESDKNERVCTHTHTHIQKRHRKPGDGLRGGGGVGKHNLSVKGPGFHCPASPKTEWQLSAAPLSIWPGDLATLNTVTGGERAGGLESAFSWGIYTFKGQILVRQKGVGKTPCAGGGCVRDLWRLLWPGPRPALPGLWSPRRPPELASIRALRLCTAGPAPPAVPIAAASHPCQSAGTVTRTAPFPGTHNGLWGHPGVSEGEDILSWDLNRQVLHLRSVI